MEVPKSQRWGQHSTLEGTANWDRETYSAFVWDLGNNLISADLNVCFLQQMLMFVLIFFPFPPYPLLYVFAR